MKKIIVHRYNDVGPFFYAQTEGMHSDGYGYKTPGEAAQKEIDKLFREGHDLKVLVKISDIPSPRG